MEGLSPRVSTASFERITLAASIYNFPRNAFTIARIAFSLRRYQRHCPFFVASTSPALVRIPM